MTRSAPASADIARPLTQADVSVVIVNWNTADLLAGCLETLPSAAGCCRLEILVVDNGSTDGSPAMIRRRFPQVHLIENTVNLGFARANNQALRQAQGRYLLLLNSDTRACPGSIARLAETLDSDPRLGIVGAQLLNEDGSPQNSAAPTPTLLTELGNKSLWRWLTPRKFATKFADAAGPVPVDSVLGAALLARTETIAQIGLLDEGYFFFLEETDWCLRARQAGWGITCEPRARIYHLQGRSAGQVNVQARIEYWRSRYRFFRKHRGKWVLVLLMIGLLVRLVFDLLCNILAAPFVAGARRRVRVGWAVILWHLAGCPRHGGLQKNLVTDEPG